MKKRLLTAVNQSLLNCPTCNLLSYSQSGENTQHMNCPRCGKNLHSRRPNSISRTWALLITAVVLYIPANIFPIMTVTQLGKSEADTILTGVKSLIEADMWSLAALIFFASIIVPILKVIMLLFLLISVQFHSNWRPKERTALYRITESVGRWSMIDIFVLSILVALVRLGNIATIEPGIGATSFAAVVVATMLAAMAFDPRLIWDAADPANNA